MPTIFKYDPEPHSQASLTIQPYTGNYFKWFPQISNVHKYLAGVLRGALG